MNEHVLPELKQIVGAMLLVRKDPLTVSEIRRVLTATAERRGGVAKDFARATETMIQEALAALQRDFSECKVGFHLAEVAGGWKLENDANCGPWLRVLLQKGRGARLSLPALETLAIIAYRQPCVRSEIEAVRGVAVDQILRNLLEMQLIRVVGRSDLPGRPWMFGTTQKFLEHFGLKSLEDLPGTDELRRMEAEQSAKASPGPAAQESAPVQLTALEEEAIGPQSNPPSPNGDADVEREDRSLAEIKDDESPEEFR